MVEAGRSRSLGRSKPTPSREWLRHYVATARYLAAPLNQVLCCSSMQLIRCTGKLQKELGLKKSNLAEISPKFSFMGQWHANLIYIDRRKCLVFVNDRTRFNFIEPDVSRAYIRDMADWFQGSLSCVLHEENLPKEVINRILSEYDEIRFAKTDSKSVLGSLNDLALNYEYMILNNGGVYSPMVPEIIRKLNHMPMSPIGWNYAINELKSLYGVAT